MNSPLQQYPPHQSVPQSGTPNRPPNKRVRIVLAAIAAGIAVGVVGAVTAVALTRTDSVPARSTVATAQFTVDTARAIGTKIPLSDANSRRDLVVHANTAYVTDNDGTVRVIDLASGNLSFIKVGSEAEGAAIDTGTGNLYVASNGHDYVSGNLSVISTSTKSVVANIPTKAYAEVVAVDPESHVVFVAGGAGSDVDNQTSTLGVIDGKTSAVTAEIPVEGRITNMVVDTKAHVVYATIYRAQKTVLNIIDPAARSVTPVVPLGMTADIAWSAKSNTVYAAVSETPWDSSQLYSIDPQGRTVTAKVPLGQTMATPVVDPRNGDVFTVGGSDKDGAGCLLVYSAPTLTLTKTITIAPGMKTVGFHAAAVDSDSGNVYLLDYSPTLFAVEH